MSEEISAPEATAAKPIVRMVETVPTLEALPPAGRPKVRVGEPLRFALDVICETDGEFGKKRAFLPSMVPGGPSFEILSDEGKVVGGHDTAPSPLGYFTAGFAFCLMTHITGYLRFVPLKISKVKLEVRGSFWSELGHIDEGGQGRGGGDRFETYVIVESEEPAEKLRDFIAVCEEACVASQTIAKAIPASLSIVLNGETV